jgi:moderate conductance mechanosensitive channel
VTTPDPQTRARRIARLLMFVAVAVAGLALGSLALDRFGVTEPRWNPHDIVRWMLSHGVNIVIIVIGAAVVIRAASLAIDRLQNTLGNQHADLEWQRRASTIGGILTNLVTLAVAFVAVMMLLSQLDIDVVPILTGAGIVGLAVGFGAQNLVRDFISGFFLILEDQVRVGDSARVNGVSGVVEQINLRTIVVRDEEGAVQVFPNGTITTLTNRSKQFAYALVDVRVSYRENVDRAIGTLREIGTAMEHDPAWSGLVLEPLEIQGVTSLEDTFATVRIRFKTLPLNQGKVSSELRRRIMTMFVARGIKPYAG